MADANRQWRPTRKTSAGALAGAAVTVLTLFAPQMHITIDASQGAAITTFISALTAYFTPAGSA